MDESTELGLYQLVPIVREFQNSVIALKQEWVSLKAPIDAKLHALVSVSLPLSGTTSTDGDDDDGARAFDALAVHNNDNDDGDDDDEGEVLGLFTSVAGPKGTSATVCALVKLVNELNFDMTHAYKVFHVTTRVASEPEVLAFRERYLAVFNKTPTVSVAAHAHTTTTSGAPSNVGAASASFESSSSSRCSVPGCKRPVSVYTKGKRQGQEKRKCEFHTTAALKSKRGLKRPARREERLLYASMKLEDDLKTLRDTVVPLLDTTLAIADDEPRRRL